LNCTKLENLGPVHLKYVYFVPQILDLSINDLVCFAVLLLVIDINLDQQIPLLLLCCKTNRLLPCEFVFSTDIDCSINIENTQTFGLLICGSLDIRFDLVILLLLHIAVEQQCSVILVVVRFIVLLFVWVLGQLLQVRDEIVKLRNLNELLDDIGGI